MYKLSKEALKRHELAMALLKKKELTEDQTAFFYENFSPMAMTNIGPSGVFFTPLEYARQFAIFVSPCGRILDLCAGIGILSYAIWHQDRMSKPCEISEIVAVEIEPKFVEIGKKLLPDITWINGSIADEELIKGLGEFDWVISNPPYGNVKSMDNNWLKVKGPAHFSAMEIALKVSQGGSFIIPAGNSDFDLKKRKSMKGAASKTLGKFYKDVFVNPVALDYDEYKSMWSGTSIDTEIVHVESSFAPFIEETQLEMF